MGYASGRTTEIPRDTERYQELPFGGGTAVPQPFGGGIPTVILWYLMVSLGMSAAPPTPEIPRDTKRIPLGHRPPNGISWYLLVLSLGISAICNMEAGCTNLRSLKKPAKFRTRKAICFSIPFSALWARPEFQPGSYQDIFNVTMMGPSTCRKCILLVEVVSHLANLRLEIDVSTCS